MEIKSISASCLLLVSHLLSFATTPSLGDELFWVGGGVTNVLNSADNWTRADGTHKAPVAADELVITNSIQCLQWDLNTVFQKITMRDPATSVLLTRKTGSYTIYAPTQGIVNETTAGVLSIYRLNRQNKTDTVIIDVVNPNGKIRETSHDCLTGTVVKRGKGLYQASADSYGNFFSSSADYRIEAGTFFIPFANDNSTRFTQYRSTFTFVGDDPSATLSLGDSNSSYRNYQLSGIRESGVGHEHTVCDNGRSATLNFTGVVENVTFSGRFTKTLSVNWNPENEATLTLNGGCHTTTGSFLVRHGTLALANGAVLSTAPIQVHAGATLEIDAASSSQPNLALSLAEGAKVRLSGGAVVCAKSVKIGEAAAVASGIYKAGTTDWLDGDGTFVLMGSESTTATWTGEGSDDLITTPENWGVASTSDLPDLVFGTLVATFPAGATPKVPADGRSYWLRGLRTEGAFSISAAAGAKPLRLGANGIAGTGPLTVSAPIEMVASQDWRLEGDATLTETGVLSSAMGVELRVIVGANKFDIYSSNPNLKAISTWGVVHLHADDAVGGTS